MLKRSAAAAVIAALFLILVPGPSQAAWQKNGCGMDPNGQPLPGPGTH